MVLKTMKILIRIFIWGLLVICFSCEDKSWFIDCAECLLSLPDEISLTVKLTGNEFAVDVNIYEGEIEDSVLYSSAEIWGDKYTPSIRLNKKYTFAATYHINNKTYIAIDSATPRIKYDEDDCEDPCYLVYDKIIDLRLKYTAN
jgi:hypothetical protein